MKDNLNELPIGELETKLQDYKKELRVERFKAVTSKVENPKKVSGLKKSIARILTLKREYDLGIRTR